MVTRLLKDDVLRKAIDKKVSRRGKKVEKRGEDRSGERRAAGFVDGFEAINAEVERLVNERFKQEKGKQVQQQKLQGSHSLYSRLSPTSPKPAATQSLAPSPPPRSTIATSAFKPPQPRRAVPRLPLLPSLSPQQAITQNLSILKRTHQFFLGNMRLKGKAEQTLTDRSFFLTS